MGGEFKIGVFRGHSGDPRVKNTVDSFIEGLKFLGEDVFVDTEFRECDVAVIWGISSKRHHKKTKYRDLVRKEQTNTIVIERGFLKREAYYSVGWGDTGGLGDYVTEDVPFDRWEKLGVSLEPWRTTGNSVVVCGQVPHDTSVQHVDYSAWVQSTIQEIRSHTDRQIVFRQPPFVSESAGSVRWCSAFNQLIGRGLEDSPCSRYAYFDSGSRRGRSGGAYP